MALKNLYVSTTALFKLKGNLEGLIQTKLKGYYNNAIDIRI